MIRHFFYSLRPRQWIKNLLIFMPLVFGKKLFVYPENLCVAAGFVIFSLVASSVYLVNDLWDLELDKSHRTKRLRPIPSGKIGAGTAASAAAVLAAVSVGAAYFLEPRLALVILVYLALNLIYTRRLKHIVIIDVFCLAAFFLIRIVAGTVLADVAYSHWMLFMVVLLALFLGFNKRRQELRASRSEAGEQRSVLRQYGLYFIDQMISVLTSSVVIVYMLYTIDSKTVGEVGSNHLIYTIPFVYYGIFRYLYLVHKRHYGEDPTSVVYTDRMIQLNLLVWMAACVAVIYYGL